MEIDENLKYTGGGGSIELDQFGGGGDWGTGGQEWGGVRGQQRRGRTDGINQDNKLAFGRGYPLTGTLWAFVILTFGCILISPSGVWWLIVMGKV